MNAAQARLHAARDAGFAFPVLDTSSATSRPSSTGLVEHLRLSMRALSPAARLEVLGPLVRAFCLLCGSAEGLACRCDQTGAEGE